MNKLVYCACAGDLNMPIGGRHRCSFVCVFSLTALVIQRPQIHAVHVIGRPRNVGYMAELEEARLPHKLEELADCPAEDIVRALRRDHRYFVLWLPFFSLA